MSKTKRTIIRGGWATDNGKLLTVDDTAAKHKKRPGCAAGKRMRPYAKGDNPYKERYKRGEHHSYTGQPMGNTRKGTKLENANANRSLKKGARQKAKNELREQIVDIFTKKAIQKQKPTTQATGKAMCCATCGKFITKPDCACIHCGSIKTETAIL